jgi:hypothetical protein
MSLYVDGVLECAIANTTDYTEGSCVVGSGTTAFYGYIDDFRVTKGVARFASGYTYTVPAAAFPDYGRYVAGSLTESSSHTEFTVRTHRLDTGALLNEITATGASYECPCCPVAVARVDYAGPVMVAAWPKLGVPWTANAVKTVGDYVFPANPVTTPYVYRATVADPVVLLMHLDGTDNGTSFPDLCGHTPITRTGEVVTKTATKKVGTASAYFDGNGDTLYFTTGAEFDFGTGDFTIEAWINIDAGSSGPRQIIDKFTVWSSDVDFAFEIGSDGKLAFWAGDGIPLQIRGNAVLNTGQWYHVAVCRASGTTRLFVDGVTQTATHTGSVTIPNGRTTLAIGSNGFAANYWKGYLDEIRVTRSALYTADFTPPTTAFAYGTGSSEPTWPTTPGATVIDGAVTWTCVDRMLQPVLHGPLIPSL